MGADGIKKVNIYLNASVLRGILAILLLISTITGCSSSKAQERDARTRQVFSSDRTGELEHARRSRTYYLHTPKSYQPDHPMPLVLVFHGSNGSGRSISKATGFDALADEKGFIVVYPDAINHQWSIKNGMLSLGVDDISFTAALIDDIKQIRNVDNRRIYATGFSSGGIFSQVVACELSDRIAAIASVAGSMPEALESSCQPKKPVSILMLNGTGDRDVPYAGGKIGDTSLGVISVAKNIELWRSHNNCPSQANLKQLPDNNPRDNLKIEISSYSGCRDGSEVMLVTVKNGGHAWPGSIPANAAQPMAVANSSIDASEAIWEFFQRHTLP